MHASKTSIHNTFHSQCLLAAPWKPHKQGCPTNELETLTVVSHTQACSGGQSNHTSRELQSMKTTEGRCSTVAVNPSSHCSRLL